MRPSLDRDSEREGDNHKRERGEGGGIDRERREGRGERERAEVVKRSANLIELSRSRRYLPSHVGRPALEPSDTEGR